MANTIFFSWQDDTNSKVGKYFLRDVLEEVKKELSIDNDIDEALREGLTIDSDTQGEAGQPPIAATILGKIDNAAVVVADLTFVGKRLDGRPTPNPNVLIEYGYALKALSHRRVISVMNEAFGEASRESLPFDLAHSRWPTRYKLETNLKEEMARVKKKLVADLKVAIRASLAVIPSPTSEAPSLFVPVIHKNGPATFRHENEELGIDEGFGSQKSDRIFLESSHSAMWLRVFPQYAQKQTWPIYKLKEVAQASTNLPPLVIGRGYNWLQAEDGWGTYVSSAIDDPTDQRKKALNVAFAFETGEIWSVDTALLNFSDKRLPYTDIENTFVRGFTNYIHFLTQLGVSGPFKWHAGLTGVKERKLGYPPPPNHSWVDEGPTCLAQTIEMEGTWSEGQSSLEALLPFFNKLFEKCGRQRPDYLSSK